MRFQCRIGDGVAPTLESTAHLATLTPTAPHAERAAPPRETGPSRWVGRSAIAAAVIAVAGCATGSLPRGAAPAKSYKIAPVYSVTNAGSNAESYFALGQYHEEASAWDKASDAYRKAVGLDARHVESWNALGVTLAHAGRYAEAEAALRQAVALAPQRPHLSNNLGYVLLLAGKPAEAVAVLQPMIKGQEVSDMAQANLRQALARAGLALAGAQPAAGTTAALAASTSAAVPPSVAVARVAPASVPAPVTTDAVPSAGPPTMRVGYEPDTPALQLVEATPQLPKPAAAAADPIPPAAAGAMRSTVPPARLEVTNGNGVTGMASQVGRWLDRRGMPVARVSNQQPFVQRVTIVQYREGHEEAALRVARALPMGVRADIAAAPGLRGDVRVLLGRDWVQAAACLSRDTCQPNASAVAAVGGVAVAAAQR